MTTLASWAKAPVMSRLQLMVRLGPVLWVVAAAGCAERSYRVAPPLPPKAGGPADPAPPVQLAGLDREGTETDEKENGKTPETLPPGDHPLRDGRRRYVLDLPTALQLALGQNPHIALARERVATAQAQFDRAAAQWLPSLVIEPAWTRHDGQIQDTRGEVIGVSRSAAFAGGGARLAVSTSDAYFGPLAARQIVAARSAGSLAVTNQTLRDVSLQYWNLVEAQGRLEVFREAERNTSRIDDLAQSYLRAGKLKPADADRVRTQRLARLVELTRAEGDVRAASAELARMLRLDPFLELTPADQQAVPVDCVDEALANADFAALALSNRPELAEHRALADAAAARLRQARVAPLLPSLVVDVTAGGFGGGPDAFFGDFDGRSDVAAGAIWRFQNLGLGDQATVRERASESRRAELRVVAAMDEIVTHAADAAFRVRARRNQLQPAGEAVASAADAFRRHVQLFADGGVELIQPLEVLQSVTALSQARQAYLEAVIEYNRSQVQLYWAIGSPLDETPPARR